MTKPKNAKKTTEPVETTEVETETEEERLEARIEFISEMMQLAESLLDELKTGETVEKVKDADHAIEEARDFARQILALKFEKES